MEIGCAEGVGGAAGVVEGAVAVAGADGGAGAGTDGETGAGAGWVARPVAINARPRWFRWF